MTELIKNSQGFLNKEELSKSFGTYSALFFSMFSSTEHYLSNNSSKTKNTVKKIKNKTGKLLKRTKDNLIKLLAKPADGIERLLDSNEPQKSTDLKKEIFEGLRVNNAKYAPTTKKFSVSQALKELYASFVNYGNKGYEAIKTKTKKVMGNVKLTMAKIVKLAEYIMAVASPQWNMPYGSKFDRDVLAQAVSPQGSISEEDAKYQIGYNYLRYRE